MTDGADSSEPLVKALFGISPRTPDDVFEGWHRPDDDWNGFAVPTFDRVNAERVTAWVARGYEGYPPEHVPTTFTWDGDVLIQIDRDGDEEHVERFDPGEDGRYAIGAGSWTWEEVEVPPGRELGDWLDWIEESSDVHARANNITLSWLRLSGVDGRARGRLTNEAARRAVEFLTVVRPEDPDADLRSHVVQFLYLDHFPDEAPYTWARLTAADRERILDDVVRSAVAAALFQM